MRVAAIQMQVALGQVEENCQAARRLIIDAADAGAELIVLPEFFTSGIAYHPSMLDASRPIDGLPAQLLCELARVHQVIVGGSFLATRPEGVFNTFVLAFADGSIHYHDKDIPTMWENCYYQGGHDDGCLQTSIGSIGVALCWEQIRTQTVNRLRGRVDMVIGGSCWWDAPFGSRSEDRIDNAALNASLYRKAPPTFAKLLGVPFVHAAHSGEFQGLTPGDEERVYNSRWMGRAQIVDGNGEVLAQATQEDGEEVVIADVTLGSVTPCPQQSADGFWIHTMPPAALKAWEFQNSWGRGYYQDIATKYREKSE